MSFTNTEHRLKRPAGSAEESGGLKSGMTLMELLIVMVIVVITSAVLLTLYRITVTSYVKQDARLEQTQNLRSALHTIARDARMAGNFYSILSANIRLVQAYVPHMEQASTNAGVSRLPIGGEAGWFTHLGTTETGVRPIFGTDGGENGPDTLTIIRAEIETSQPLGVLTNEYIPGPGTAVINIGFHQTDTQGRDGDIIAITNGAQAGIFQVSGFVGTNTTLNIATNGRFYPAAGATNISFPAESEVYNLRDVTLVTYYLDQANNNLMATFYDTTVDANDPGVNRNAPTVIATDIEDFQVNFFSQDQDITHDPDAPTVITPAFLDQNTIIGINVGLVARSSYGDNNGDRYQRPGLFNRVAAPDSQQDDHYRSVLVETIDLRNFADN